MTAAITCTALKAEYQAFDQLAWLMKTTATTSTTPASSAVSGPDERASAGVCARRFPWPAVKAIGRTSTRPARPRAARRSRAARTCSYGHAPRTTPSPSMRNADRCGDVPHPAEVERDAEAVRRLGVPVGEEREVEVERLHPRDVRPRRVARDRVRLHAGRAELLAPVTQELHLVRSGRRPVEEVEEQQDRAVGDDLARSSRSPAASSRRARPGSGRPRPACAKPTRRRSRPRLR